jgi:hypothetical protein
MYIPKECEARETCVKGATGERRGTSGKSVTGEKGEKDGTSEMD